MLNIALPKGRLGDSVYRMFAEIGLSCPEMLEDNRKLIFENKENEVMYFLVKPSDVAIYVENGAADIGVVGKDVLLESEPNVYELLDMGIGKCSVAVAAPNDYKENQGAVLRVATKYPRIAKEYYTGISRKIELIKLNGSMELAPCVNLSDVIVDIVETGSTLRENNLKVTDHIKDISARLICNKTSFKFKNERIADIENRLREVISSENSKV